MRVLVVNAGSSSLKLQVLDGEAEAAAHTVERWSGESGADVIGDFLGEAGHLDAVGHRVVHGGDRFVKPTPLDDEVVAYLDSLVDLAPLHEPEALAAIRALRELLPDIPQVACFDTAFHATIPSEASTYAIPPEWSRRWRIRKYGFHGLSHAYASGHAARLIGAKRDDLRTVTCHLGAGASLCAVRNGVSVDTTMGFTPLAGLVMVTRSGDVDPGMLLWLIETAGVPVSDVSNGLQHLGGLAGLSGTSGDMRDVNAAIERGGATARLALDVFNYRLACLAGQMVVATRGLDLLVFTGGIGEHDPAVRSRLVAHLDHLGMAIDESANSAATGDAVVSSPQSSAAVVVVTAREDVQIAREVASALAAA